MPQAIIHALIQIKEAAAQANNKLGVFPHKQITLIEKTADEILDGQHNGEFPLKVWQTGSGTQSNINVNEVIANRGNQITGKKVLHPHSSVNHSQSSNDTFPSALHIAATTELTQELIPRSTGSDRLFYET